MSSRFDPRLYTLLHTGNDGDLDFYVTLCAEARSVLELGCGAGRILGALPVPIRVGLDLSPGMIERARAALRRVELHVGDMLDFDLGRRFERVIIPYNGLYCVADDDQAVQVLRRAAAHLEPGGIIAFDGYQVLAPPEELVDDDAFELIDRVEGIDVEELDRHWPERRDCAVTYRHRGPGVDHTYTIHHHYQTPWTVWDLLADAGLRYIAMWGDFDRTPVEAGDRLVVLATHADPEEDEADEADEDAEDADGRVD